MTESDGGPHWNDELGSWEYPHEESLKQAGHEHVGEPSEEKKQTHRERVDEETIDLTESLSRWQSEGGAK